MHKKKHVVLGLLLRLGALALGIYLVVGLVVNQVAISSKQQALAAAQAQLEQQQAENEDLARILQSGDEMKIIERIARDRLGYAMPDERVFVDANGG